MSAKNDVMGSGDAAIGEYANDELSLRQLTELSADRAVVIASTYFDGGNVLRCLSGSFRFTFGDGAAVTLTPGEAVVVYPGNTVTIESLRAGGRLRYVVLMGTRVDAFFGSFGFFDRLTFRADGQEALFREAVARHSAGNAAGALSLLRDAFVTFARQLRMGGLTQLYDAIALMQRNLDKDVPEARLKPVFDALKVSRATLHRLFVQNGLPGPGEFLRREQFRRASLMLTTTALPVGEIGRRVGIESSAYFTAFIQRMAHAAPSALRRRK